MSTSDKCCSIVPYFKIKEGYTSTFKTMCEEFVKLTKNEPKCLYYGFCFDGDLVHCREGYSDAEGVLKHLENVGNLLQEALKIAALVRLEIHGPASEIDKLRQPLEALSPQYFILEYGFRN